jgi:glycine cleavage system pyridoxal-binding protein P
MVSKNCSLTNVNPASVEVHLKALTLAKSFTEAGFTLVSEQFFDTITVNTDKAKILFNYICIDLLKNYKSRHYAWSSLLVKSEL